MAKCRPSKWVIPWVLLGAGLPWLAAAWINGGSLKADIASRAASALAGNESTAWAQLQNDGRDFLVSGTSPSQAAADAAVKAVAGTYGVRSAMAAATLKIEPPKPLQPASVPSGATWPYAITGTWPEAPGASLSAKLAERNYVLGSDAALTSDGKGNFTFAPTDTLAPGTYDVEFAAKDAAGAASTAKLAGAIVIPAPVAAPQPAESVAAPQPAEPVAAPQPAEPVATAQGEAPATPTPPPPTPVEMAAPTVERQLDLSGSPILHGTWPEGVATGLTVGLGSKTYTLGKDANLASKEGKWSLIPSAGLKDGIYDVVVTATDANGKAVKDEGVAEVEVDAVPPDAPAVTAYSGEGSPASVAGTWPEGQATGLKVAIPQANLAAELGAAGSPLTSDGAGNWSLALPTPLPPGSYDVEVSTTDNRGRLLSTTSPGGIVVAEGKPAPPPVPKIGLYAAAPPADAAWPYAITGRWSEGTATSLTADLAGKTYELGKDSELTSDGKGVFTFAPAADSVPPGNHSITFTSKGPAGDTRVANVTITVPEAPAAQPPAAEPAAAQPMIPERPFSCETTLARLNQVFPVRFGFNRSKLEGIASLSLSQYAALLKDPRCAAMKVEIGGHADYFGPEDYNVWLSELRANTVLAALKEAGVPDASLSIKGYGESNPLDPAQTNAAREKNRRVEFTAMK